MDDGTWWAHLGNDIYWAYQKPFSLFSLLTLLLSFQVSISFFFSHSFPSPFSQISRSAQEKSPSLEDCQKLLKGERDEQHLNGVLLVTKFCKGDNLNSLHRVYNTVILHFLHRLFDSLDLLFLFQEKKNCWNLIQITCLFVCVLFLKGWEKEAVAWEWQWE